MVLVAEFSDLESKLDSISEDEGDCLSYISQYFIRRYNFDSLYEIISFTDDNPSTILALPLRSLDVIISLETFTTLLISTSFYKPDPAIHFMS